MTRDTIRSAERELVATLGVDTAQKGRRLSHWLIRSVAGAMALGFGAWMMVMLLPHWIEFRDRQPPKPDAPHVAAEPIVQAPIIAPDVTTSVLGTDASISEEAQQLVLVATTQGRVASDSTASLGTDPRNPQTYGLGAILANGAVISEIHADRIVLTMNGRRSTLAVDHAAASRVAMRDTLAQSKNASSTVLDSLSTPAGADPATTIGGPISLKRPLDRTSTSRDNLSEVMRSQPVFEREEFAGLQIFAGTQRGALAILGLQEGDIVRTVEGRRVEGEGDWQVIDDAVSAGTSIVIGIEREGSMMSIKLDGAQLANSTADATSPASG